MEGAGVGVELGGADANSIAIRSNGKTSGVGSGVGEFGVKGEGEEFSFESGAGEVGGLLSCGGIADLDVFWSCDPNGSLLIGVKENACRFWSFCELVGEGFACEGGLTG